MATNWTPAQQEAINTKNKTLLLSAAAGSGKTSTLTERIIRSITDKDSPADIGNMLIVTFTRASAADLKTKIYNALTKALAEDPSNKHLTRQLIKLGSARISTIDAFYLAAVKENFATLGISSSFRIVDSTETDLLAKSVMGDVINSFYDNVEDFSSLCECFERIRDAEDVMEGVLLSLYQECLGVPEGVEYVKICAEQCKNDADSDFLASSFGAVIKDYVLLIANAFLGNYQKALEAIENDEKIMRAYYDQMSEDRALCIELIQLLDSKECNYDELVKLVNSYEPKKLGSVRNATEQSIFCKGLRSTFKSRIELLSKSYLCYTSEDISDFFKSTSKNLYLLYDVLAEFEKRYFEEKDRRNILELSDIKRYAYKLFVDKNKMPTDTAKAYAEQFSDIYIDEYQDVDPVQDLIFNAISTPHNRFMVGDIKQSIYGFRGAAPSLFASYRKSFPKHGTTEAEYSTNETIFMSENFRCAKPIIDFTNLVCGDLFSACKDSIGYTSDDDLVFSLPPVPSEKVSVTLFAKAPKSKDSDGELPKEKINLKQVEADCVAYEIKRLLKNGKKQDGSPIKPSDIAVLFRSKSALAPIEEALTRQGIKTSISDSTSYFQNPDVLMTLSILNAIDNPQRDIYLAGALKSPIFGFSVEDVLLINQYGDKSCSLYDKLCIAALDDTELGRRCASFNDTLCHMRDMSTSVPIDKFLKYLFSTENFVASGLVCDKSSSGEGGNLKQLYEYARTFESGTFKGLYSFIEFINSIIDSGKTLPIGGEESGDECVSLMTIHKSKGLEFPVCFICNTAAALTRSDKNKPFCFEYGVGIAMHLSDPTGFAVYESPLFNTLALYKQLLQAEEEMRVLYVAMTRARERLYITAQEPMSLLNTVVDKAKLISLLDDRYFVLTAGSYLEWILSSTLSKENDCCTINLIDSDHIPCYTASDVEQVSDNETFDEELYQRLKQKFAFEYQDKLLRRVPAKLSVSRLSPTVLDEDDGAKDIFEPQKPATVPDLFLQSASRATSAERGTATHLFLQFCDFEFAARHGAQETLAMLTQKSFLPSNVAELVYIDDIEKLLNSEFLKKILSAKKVIREQRFNMLVPTRELTTDKELIRVLGDRKTAVQGVIDLILIEEDGSIGLYDYKTDRLTREELANDDLAKKKLNEAHSLQLSYYARAVKYLFGRDADRVAVYSTAAAKLFDIEPHDLCVSHDIL